MDTGRSRLSALWLFATLNYLYCDVLTLMDPEQLRGFLAGNVGGMDIGPEFLVAAGVLVEIPIAMVLLSRVLAPRSSRVASIVAGIVMTAVQTLSLFVKAPAPYYLFFSIIEIAATSAIVFVAWRWGVPRLARPNEVSPGTVAA